MKIDDKFYRKYGSSGVIIPPPLEEEEEIEVPQQGTVPEEPEVPEGKEYEDKFYYYEEPEEDPQKYIKTRPEGLKRLLNQEIISEEDSDDVSLSSDELLAMCSEFCDYFKK